jgi:hypothetical protein
MGPQCSITARKHPLGTRLTDNEQEFLFHPESAAFLSATLPKVQASPGLWPSVAFSRAGRVELHCAFSLQIRVSRPECARANLPLEGERSVSASEKAGYALGRSRPALRLGASLERAFDEASPTFARWTSGARCATKPWRCPHWRRPLSRRCWGSGRSDP